MQNDPTTGRFEPDSGAHVDRVCEECGRSFVAWRSAIARGGGRFCSRACADAGQEVDLASRFWSRVRKTDGCWLWTGRTDEKCYGLIDVGGGKGRPQKASRVAWFLETGAWPTDDVLHHCDTPPCIRFGHLWLGGNADNIADKVSKGRQIRGERQWAAQLTDDQVRAIRRRWAGGGVQQKAIAIDHGVSRSTICDLIAGRTWKHVTDHP